ncbi:hypothetical protein FGO68_gene7289 [Halteria grandinella]|uniref:Uncharacterized protein n=1 Tax=Halteria grandinella TaxID=5974 RepID=A0A8J8P1G3_HALGN|nr:hypothetical protein FGO68_gene7289 [Halteria grandinella]
MLQGVVGGARRKHRDDEFVKTHFAIDKSYDFLDIQSAWAGKSMGSTVFIEKLILLSEFIFGIQVKQLKSSFYAGSQDEPAPFCLVADSAQFSFQPCFRLRQS